MRNLMILLCAGLFLASPLHAADLSIAVVDVQTLMSQSKASQSIQEKANNHRTKFLEEISVKEEKLRAAEKDLIENRESMSEEEFAEKKSAFEQEFIAAQKFSRDRKVKLDKAYADAMQILMTNVNDAIQKIADEENYDLVLANSSVLVKSKSLNITDAAMKALNDKVSDIGLEISEE